MAVTDTVRMSFKGHFVQPSFLDFLDRRAARLDLDVAVTSSGVDSVAVAVSGQRDLIDAFEMACSLGPIDCLVLDVERSQIESGD